MKPVLVRNSTLYYEREARGRSARPAGSRTGPPRATARREPVGVSRWESWTPRLRCVRERLGPGRSFRPGRQREGLPRPCSMLAPSGAGPPPVRRKSTAAAVPTASLAADVHVGSRELGMDDGYKCIIPRTTRPVRSRIFAAMS
jgi:hypothetical protein